MKTLLVFLLALPWIPQANAQTNHEAKATVHFYREKAYVGSARKMPIYVDEIKIADLVNGRYFTAEFDPGKHTFRCQTKLEAIQFQLEAGNDYYLRAELIQTFMKNRWKIMQVAKEQGEGDIKLLKPLDPKHIAPLAR